MYILHTKTSINEYEFDYLTLTPQAVFTSS